MQFGHYNYLAFISYKREDESWAKWLQRKLEYYKLPTSIIERKIPFSERPRRVFKDTTDLSGGFLEKAIKAGLNSSKYLIVICSPRAAQSPWVCKEVQEFIDSGREEFIIPFIIDGEPNSKEYKRECFPQALRSLAGEHELLGVNVNENGREVAVVKVVARMFDVTFDSLWQRFTRNRNNRRKLIWSILLLLIFSAFIVICYILKTNLQLDKANKEIVIQRNNANKERDNAKALSIELKRANDSIMSQQNKIKIAYDKVIFSERNLKISNSKLQNREKELIKEKDNLLWANYELIYNESENLLRDDKVDEAIALLRPILINNINNDNVLFKKMESVFRRSYEAMQNDTLTIVSKQKWNVGTMEYGNRNVCFDNNSSKMLILSGDVKEFDIASGLGRTCVETWPDYLCLRKGNVVCFTEGNAEIYDSKDYSLIETKKFQDDTIFMTASADGNRFATSSNGKIYVWDIETEKLVNIFEGGSASLNYDGSVLATSQNGYNVMYNTDNKSIYNIGATDYCEDVRYDGTGKFLVLWLKKYNTIRLLNMQTNEDYLIEDSTFSDGFCSIEHPFVNNEYNGFVMSNDYKFIVLNNKIFDIVHGTMIKKLEHTDNIIGVHIYPGASKVVQVNVDGNIYVYNRNGKSLYSSLFINNFVDFSSYISKNSKSIRQSFADSYITYNDVIYTRYSILNNLKIGTSQLTWEKINESHQKSPYEVMYNNNTLMIFNSITNQIAGEIKDVNEDVYQVGFSPDFRYILVAEGQQKTAVYDVRSGEKIQEFPYVSGDGNIGFGSFDSNWNIYFIDSGKIDKYKFHTLKELLHLTRHIGCHNTRNRINTK